MAAEQMDRTAYLMELDPVYASAIVRRFVAYRGNTEDVYIIRDGQKLPCSEVYIPTAEELGMKDSTINDIQKGRKKGG
jgi:DNA (cytosine-5-)-methyltransferase